MDESSKAEAVRQAARTLMLKILPRREEILTIPNELKHIPLQVLLQDVPKWPFSQGPFGANLDFELEPYYHRPINMLVLDRGNALSHDDIQYIMAMPLYVFGLFFASKFAYIRTIFENTLPTSNATDGNETKKVYSQYILNRGENSTKYLHGFTLDEVVDSLQADRFDVILEASVFCEDGRTLFEEIENRLLAVGHISSDIKYNDGSSLRNKGGNWYLGMHVDLTLCEGTNLRKLEGRIASHLRHGVEEDSAKKLAYWLGDVLVFNFIRF